MIAAHRCLAIVCVTALAAAACGRSTPSPPTTTPTPGERVTGSERLGWDQPADDAAAVASFHFVFYLDNARIDAAGASCATTAQAAGFACSAQLPSMTVGTHTLELAAISDDGIESARSAPLTITRVTAVTTAAITWRSTRITTADDVALRADIVAAGFDNPADLAFAPDGRLLVAERAGEIAIVDASTTPVTVSRDPAGVLFDDINVANGGGLLGVTVDPQFQRTHYVYVVYTATSPTGATVFRLARLRETRDRFADRVVLLDNVPASQSPSAALRFGPDQRLYVAFDDGGSPSVRGDLSAPGGKVLRLNADGSTPDDQAAATPVFSWPFTSPRALGWTSAARALWIADASSGAGQLDAVTIDDATRVRGTTRVRYTLPLHDVAGMAAYTGAAIEQFRGDLLVAAGNDEHILRVRFDGGNPFQITATERLLQGRVGPIRAITVGPDGAIYFATDTTLGKLGPSAM